MTVKNTFRSYATARRVFARARAATNTQIVVQQRMAQRYRLQVRARHLLREAANNHRQGILQIMRLPHSEGDEPMVKITLIS